MLKLREYGLLRLGHPKYLLDVDAVLSTEADIREELTTEMERLLLAARYKFGYRKWLLEE